MSEFTLHKQSRVELLIKLTKAILNKSKVGEVYADHKQEIGKIMPSDVITAVHELMEMNLNLDELKTAINKLLNLIYQPLQDFPSSPIAEGTLLGYLQQINAKAYKILNSCTPLMKRINKTETEELKSELSSLYMKLQDFTQIYTIKENILFPLIEKEWGDYKCVQMMWSFHDDIKRDIKVIIELLKESAVFDIHNFNRLAGDISFRITAIKFRDEKILFPHLIDTIDHLKINGLLSQAKDLSFPFITPVFEKNIIEESKNIDLSLVDLASGALKPEQIRLIFNHLPVDITYVDEYDKVQFYSTPKHRIFPRTNAILGREVSNCHPPDSVHVVEKIVDAFKRGDKDKASFWIHMAGQFILIQYFAVRDETAAYRGVVEVSQEISEIQSLEGDKRLLDWE